MVAALLKGESMAFVEVKLDGDEEIRFQTFLNYLRQFNLYLKQSSGTKQELANQIWQKSSRMQGAKDYSREYLTRSLNLAWSTETIACNFGLDDPSALKIFNHWKPIQIYYAIYSCAEALAHLLTSKDQFSHKECLRTVSAFMISTKISPWSYGFTGKIGKAGKEAKALNFPEDMKFEHNLKTANVRPIDLLATCLHAEHKKRVEDHHRERTSARKKGQKRVFKYDIDPGDTTLLHFAYRLRIRSNYDGAEMYMAALSDQHIKDFDSLLKIFCDCTLMAIEIPIMRKITKNKFFELREEFEQKVAMNETLKKRMNLYSALR